MPLAGILCPIKEPKDYQRYDIKEKKFQKYKKVSLYECRHCSMGDQCGFPDLVRKRFLFPSISHKQDKPRVSVTRITGCLRNSYFNLTEPYYMDIGGFIATQVGTAIHKYFEDGFNNSETPVKWVTPKGNVLTGLVDHINIENDELIDLKTTSYGSYKKNNGASKIYELQLQIYATILKRLYNMEFKRIRIITVGLGDKICADHVIEFKDMTDYINERTDLLYEAIEKGVPPKCNPTESWEKLYCFWNDKCEG